MLTLGSAAIALLVLVGCQQKMAEQPRYEPLEPSAFFPDGRSSRPLVPGTVARGQLQTDEHFYTGQSAGRQVDTFPFPVTLQVLQRGQERYDIYCSPCHGRLGNGEGMIVRRGLCCPPSFHLDRLREAPVGHFFDVITHGFGAMAAYAAQVSPADRWAIIAYSRALQLSQRSALVDLPAEERDKVGLGEQR
jgi:hypothetical protein